MSCRSSKNTAQGHKILTRKTQQIFMHVRTLGVYFSIRYMCLDHGRKLELCTSGLSPTVYMNVIHYQVSAEDKQIEERCGQYQSFALLLLLTLLLVL